MPEPTTTREILVYLKGGKRRRVADIPADAKITFGPVSPGRAADFNAQNALRIYTSKENQLAVFVGVEEFRDLTLTVREEKRRTNRKEDSSSDSKGVSVSIDYDETVEWEDAPA